jgi:hypothetical protein
MVTYGEVSELGLHDAVKYHVAATADFLKDDPRKFDMMTPKKGTDAYRGVL